MLIVNDIDIYRGLLNLVIIITSIRLRCSVLWNDIKHLNNVVITRREACDDFRGDIAVYIDQKGLTFILRARLLLWL